MTVRQQLRYTLLLAGLLFTGVTSGGAVGHDDDTAIFYETIAEVFRHVPDSLMPYLSQNNRLDLIDFMESNMKAEVKNLLGGKSEMTVLTDDSLSIRMSDVLRVDMMLMNLDESQDSTHQVVVFVETFLTDSIYGQSVQKVYSVDWQRVTWNIPWNETQKKRMESLNLQNILNWEENILNNR